MDFIERCSTILHQGLNLAKYSEVRERTIYFMLNKIAFLFICCHVDTIPIGGWRIGFMFCDAGLVKAVQLIKAEGFTENSAFLEPGLGDIPFLGAISGNHLLVVVPQGPEIPGFFYRLIAEKGKNFYTNGLALDLY